MKAITCEMCGSTNLIKNNGVFVCQSCGTKYSVEEARKMMVDGTVDVKGTVKIDTSSELQNLYEIARRAKNTDNAENAAKYYDQILVKDPSSWEANFYVVYFKAMSCKLGEICSAGTSVSNCIPTVLNLVKENFSDETQLTNIIEELTASALGIAKMLYDAATKHYNDIDASIQHNYTQEYIYNAYAARSILTTLGNGLVEAFGDKFGTEASLLWEQSVVIHNGYLCYLEDKESNKAEIREYADKIKKYNSSYQAPAFNEGGCYIATAIYGSYDCPEVWTLRRFRDYYLANSIFGRAFIKIYYTISPTLVKWFGHSTLFNKIWRTPLDKLVMTLNNKGVLNSPYKDRNW